MSACVRAEAVNGSHSTRNKNYIISSCRASVKHYSNEPTDTASSGTSSELKKALCNSEGEKLDGEVSLRVAAKRR